MFKPLFMQRVSLKILAEDAPAAALALAEHGWFGPEAADVPDDVLPDRPSAAYHKIFHTAQTRLDKIAQRAEYARREAGETRVVRLAELEIINHRLGELWSLCSQIEEQQRVLQEEHSRIAKLQEMLVIFASLDLNLEQLQASKKSFLDLRLGTLPLSGLSRFEKAVAVEPRYFLEVFHKAGDTAYVMLAGLPSSDSQAVDRLLQTADFHALAVPPEFHDHPQKIRQELDNQSARCELKIENLSANVHKTILDCAPELIELDAALRCAAPYAELSATLRGGRGGLNLLEGWMPARELPRLRQTLAATLGKRFVLDARAPLPGEIQQVPTVLSHPRWLAPFEALVRNFGIPRYGEIDPTWLFAVTSVLMFGMMFGDVGHGLVIAALAWQFRGRLKHFTALPVAAGLSSAVFGVLYGSVFGYEGVWFHPVWMAPISDPIRMLSIALFWGIAFILSACLLKVYNLWSAGRHPQAWLDSQGVAGIAMYLGLLNAVYRLAQGGFGAGSAALLLIPLLLVLGFKWHEQDQAPLGERAIMTLMEGFDFAMSLISNTLSFMRVAAFSLNHAALAIAVFTLAAGMGAFGHWTTVVLGNVFIIAVEGAIVGIQVLRLEYYEGFARFFSGDGRAFQPLRLG